MDLIAEEQVRSTFRLVCRFDWAQSDMGVIAGGGQEAEQHATMWSAALAWLRGQAASLSRKPTAESVGELLLRIRDSQFMRGVLFMLGALGLSLFLSLSHTHTRARARTHPHPHTHTH